VTVSPVRIAVAVSLALAAAACSPTDKPQTPPPSSAGESPISTVSAEQAEAAAGALAAYNQFREYQVKAMTSGKNSRDEMVGFTGEPLLGTSLHALDSQARNGITFAGRPAWSPKASAVDLTKNPPIVTIDDCFDTTGFTPVKNGKPVPAASGTPTRFIVIVKVKKVDGRWYVFEDISPRSRSC